MVLVSLEQKPSLGLVWHATEMNGDVAAAPASVSSSSGTVGYRQKSTSLIKTL